MLKFVIKRIIMVPFLLLAIAALIFFLLNLSEADPVLMMMPAEYTQEDYDAMAERFGLDKPLPEQFVNWVVDADQFAASRCHDSDYDRCRCPPGRYVRREAIFSL